MCLFLFCLGLDRFSSSTRQEQFFFLFTSWQTSELPRQNVLTHVLTRPLFPFTRRLVRRTAMRGHFGVPLPLTPAPGLTFCRASVHAVIHASELRRQACA